MRLVLVTPPSAEIVSLAEAKRHVRVEHGDDDALIEGYVAAAVAHLDGASGWLGRALAPQTWRVEYPAFPEGGIELPLAPLTAVGSVVYRDPIAVDQTLAASAYREFGIGSAAGGGIEPVSTWPATGDGEAAVRVTFTAGHASVPTPIKQAILLLVGHWYANRETVNVGNITSELPFTVEALLTPFRVLTAR